MTPKFDLNGLQKAYYLLLIVIGGTAFAIIAENGPHAIGRAIGMLLAFGTFPLLSAWIVWRLRGKKKNAGNITFFVLVALLLIGQMGERARRIQQAQLADQILQDKDSFFSEARDAHSAEDNDQFRSAYQDYSETTRSNILKMAENSHGDEKRFYQIMEAWTAESQAIATNWQSAYSEASSDEIFDFSILNTEEDYTLRKQKLNTYINQTKSYQQYYSDLVPMIKSRLSVLGDTELVRGAIDGIVNGHNRRKAITAPLITEHLTLGETLLSLVVFLEENQSLWSVENGQMLFDNDDLLSKYEDHANTINDSLVKIDDLAAKLLDIK